MPRWWIFAPVGAFFGLIGVMAALYGKDVAALSETDVINRYAERYVAESQNADAHVTDCVAMPGTGRVWIVVRCAGYDYTVNRLGGLIEKIPLATRPPQT